MMSVLFEPYTKCEWWLKESNTILHNLVLANKVGDE
jgi:hypothetical protein